MSDGSPSHSYAGGILFYGEVAEGAGRFLISPLVSGKGHTMCEFLTRWPPKLRPLWTVRRVGRSIVEPRHHGERSG
jgi:hypothetical protein